MAIGPCGSRVGDAARTNADRLVQAQHRTPWRSIRRLHCYSSETAHSEAVLDRCSVVCQGSLAIRKLADCPWDGITAGVLLAAAHARPSKPKSRSTVFYTEPGADACRLFRHLCHHSAGHLLAPPVLAKSPVSAALASHYYPVYPLFGKTNRR